MGEDDVDGRPRIQACNVLYIYEVCIYVDFDATAVVLDGEKD